MLGVFPKILVNFFLKDASKLALGQVLTKAIIAVVRPGTN